ILNPFASMAPGNKFANGTCSVSFPRLTLIAISHALAWLMNFSLAELSIARRAVLLERDCPRRTTGKHGCATAASFHVIFEIGEWFIEILRQRNFSGETPKLRRWR